MSAAVQNLDPIPGKPVVSVTGAGPERSARELSLVPCTLTLEIPIVHFTIADLLSLEKGVDCRDCLSSQ